MLGILSRSFNVATRQDTQDDRRHRHPSRDWSLDDTVGEACRKKAASDD